MQHLQTQNSSPATKIIELLTPGLRRLLSDGDNSAAIEALARNPAALSEAGDVLAALERDASRPAGAAGVRRAIERRFVLYPQPVRTPEEWNYWWEAYYDVLADTPEPALDFGMIEWAKTAAEFLPKPGQLLALTEGFIGREGLACLRIRAAQRWLPPEPERPREALSAADRASIRDMARSFGKQLPEPRQAAIKPNYAQTDERGVSPELRALVERQRSQR